jgi:hypothetical protein
MASKKRPFKGLPALQDWPSLEELISGPITEAMFELGDRQGEFRIEDDDRYLNYVQTYIRPFPIQERAGREFRGARIRDFKLVRALANRWIYNVIWKSSDAYLERYARSRGLVRASMVTPDLLFTDLHAMLRRAEFQRRVAAAEETGVDFLVDTNAKVARDLEKGETLAGVCLESDKKYIMQAERLIDASVTYGLVEELREEDGKVIRGTKRLDEMMIRLEATAILSVCRAILGEDEDNG